MMKVNCDLLIDLVKCIHSLCVLAGPHTVSGSRQVRDRQYRQSDIIKRPKIKVSNSVTAKPHKPYELEPKTTIFPSIFAESRTFRGMYYILNFLSCYRTGFAAKKGRLN
jgi:hypothetical protein